MQNIKISSAGNSVSRYFIGQLIALIVFILLGSSLFLGLADIVTALFFDFNFITHPELLSMYSYPNFASYIRFIQAMQTIGGFLIPGILMSYFISDSVNNQLQFHRNISIRHIVICLILIVVGAPFINWTGAFNEMLHFPANFQHLEMLMRNSEASASQMINALMDTSSIGSILSNLLVIALLPAISEEVLFRGVLQNMLLAKMRKPWLAILVTAIVFSAFHMQFLSFLPRVILGVILGVLYYQTKNLWVPIIFHFFNNALGVLSSGLASSTENAMENIGVGSQWPLALISLTLLIVVVYYIKPKAKIRI